MSQPTIEEELEEEAMVMEEVEAVGEPVVEAVADKDATMRDAPEADPLTEAGPSVDAMRALLMDAVKALLGMRSDGTIHGYLQPSLVEISWQTLQEMCKLRESLDLREKLEWMIIRWLDTLVGQGHVRNATSVWGKGKQRAEKLDSDSEEELV